MLGKIVALVALGLALAAPSSRAQGSRSEIVLRGHVRDMDARSWSMAWGRQMRAEALANSHIARTHALATARIARETARASARAARDGVRRSVRVRIPHVRPVRIHQRRYI